MSSTAVFTVMTPLTASMANGLAVVTSEYARLPTSAASTSAPTTVPTTVPTGEFSGTPMAVSAATVGASPTSVSATFTVVTAVSVPTPSSCACSVSV